MIRRSMSGFKSALARAPLTLTVVIVAGLALRPESVISNVDETLYVWWRGLGDGLANRALDALARQIDRERQNADKIGTLRDDLVERLRSLGLRRDCVASRVNEGGLPREAGTERELVHLESAIGLLGSAIERADGALDAVGRDLDEREGELISLQAAAEARRMDHALAGPIGDLSMWYIRAARARALLRPAPSSGEERHARLKLSRSF
jgi:hypothetical protein